MFKKEMIAGALGLSLALTSVTTTPVRADDDIGKVIAGIAAIAIIANAAKKRSERREASRNHTYHAPRAKAPRKRRIAKVAPRECLRNQWTHAGYRQVYGAKCLNRYSQFKLPHQCRRVARYNSGPRVFFTRYCLQQFGWNA